MEKWEYMVADRNTEDGEWNVDGDDRSYYAGNRSLYEFLRAAGARGWEAVSISTGNLQFPSIFKRSLSPRQVVGP